MGIRISAKKKITDAEEADQEIKKTADADQEGGPDAEAEEAPIVVGEAQSKDWIYRILERNRS